MIEYGYDDLATTADKFDKREVFGVPVGPPDLKGLRAALLDKVGGEAADPYTVLGIDIYRYSRFPPFEQKLVPFLFDLIYRETAASCADIFAFLFQELRDVSTLQKKFIGTGDGGYQVFPTPIHGLLFALMFEFNLRTHNSNHCYPGLRQLMGPIRVRYCLTLDDLYKYEKSYYGRAIITCSRILARDQLDRFLIDSATFQWYLNHVNGIESLQTTTLQEIAALPQFSDYDKGPISTGKNLLIPADTRGLPNEHLRRIDVQKIGLTQTKEDAVDVYSIHLQASLKVSKSGETEPNNIITVSIGNMNPQGI